MKTLKIELDFDSEEQLKAFEKEFEDHFGIKKSRENRYVINEQKKSLR